MTQYIRYPSFTSSGSTTDVNLVEVGGSPITLGQALMAGSIPVVIASNQSAVPVSGTVTATNASIGTTGAAVPASATFVGFTDGSGNLTAARISQTTMSGSLSVAIASDQSTVPVSAASLPLPSGAATEATLATLNAKTAGNLVPTAFDEVAMTYVPSGPGAGQVATATYKLATVTVKTLTMSYDGSDRLSGVVAS